MFNKRKADEIKFNLSSYEKGAVKKQASRHPESMIVYRGRYAPTPSGLLHSGHAATFRTAYRRARQNGGEIFLRIEDLDRDRCKRDYEIALIEDMQWLGLHWDRDASAPEGYIRQTDRLAQYRKVLDRLIEKGVVYSCNKSRKEIRTHPEAVKNREGEVLYHESLRPQKSDESMEGEQRYLQHWRYRADYGSVVTFEDRRMGKCSYEAGVDFGDFLVWTKAGYPAYELAVVIDDIASGITEVVRGEDLLLSTARQILLYRELAAEVPEFYHCPLVKDEQGVRLAKQYDSESIRAYRERRFTPEQFWKILESRIDS